MKAKYFFLLTCCFFVLFSRPAAHPYHSTDFAVQAVQQLKEQIKQDPKNPDLHMQLGHFYSVLNQLDDARQELKTSLELQPSNDEARFILARVLVMQQKQKDALNVLDDIKDANWKDDAKIMEGTLYFQKGDAALAEKAFLAAAKLNPKNADVYLNLAGIAGVKKDYKKAEDYLKKAVAIDTSNLMAYGQLAQVYDAQKKKKEKIQTLKKLLQLLPEDSPSYQNIKGQIEKDQK